MMNGMSVLSRKAGGASKSIRVGKKGLDTSGESLSYKQSMIPSVSKPSDSKKMAAEEKHVASEYTDDSCPSLELTDESGTMEKIDCSKKIPATSINYSMVTNVIDSWDQKILKIPNWSQVTGESFLRNIFRIAPTAIVLFGFPADTDPDDPALSENKRFVSMGVKLIKAIDMAISFLGPDLEPLEEQLYQLGWAHIAMKALPPHWPLVGDALLAVFEECMIGGFTKEERLAWIKVCFHVRTL
jgi:hypothetical protein